MGQHFRAILWLRWRLRVNQLRRAGAVNAVILALLAGGCILLATILFVALFFVGLFALPKASPPVLLYVWDGLILLFLFFWATGLLLELQRSEVLSLEKFLHLPVSLTGAFLINYLSSLFSLNLIVFVPATVGLTLGLAFAKGPAVLLLLPQMVAFLLAVTALTYQFQGWLASLMVNQRRRRTVIVVATMSFILICQLPNLANLFQPWGRRQQSELNARLSEELAEFNRANALLNNPAEQQELYMKYQQRTAEIQREYLTQVEESNRQTQQQVERTARLLNLLLPPGWLPLAALTSAEGDVLPALLGTLGLTLIGTASLWRSYRTTVRLYTGQFSSGKRRPVAVAPPAKAGKSTAGLLEKRLPGLSEHAAAIALASFRSLTRAAEAKMMLLSPIILVIVFGAMFLRQPINMPDPVRPLLAFAAMAIILLSMVQLVGNQFGFDRNGFRVFVLCGAPRSDILLGKNLAFAPFALGLGIMLVVLLQAVYPMRLDYFLAVLPQFLSMYLLFCLLANGLSILAPMLIAAGSFRPANFKGIPLLLHLAFLFLFPLTLAPTLVPLGVQFVLERLGWAEMAPVGLLLSLIECVAVVYLYRLVLTWQGAWLQIREQRILEIVTTKAE